MVAIFCPLRRPNSRTNSWFTSAKPRKASLSAGMALTRPSGKDCCAAPTLLVVKLVEKLAGRLGTGQLMAQHLAQPGVFP